MQITAHVNIICDCVYSQPPSNSTFFFHLSFRNALFSKYLHRKLHKHTVLSSVAFFVYYHFVRFNYYARQGNFNIYLVSSVVSFPSGFGVASFVWAQTRYRRRGEFTFWQMPPLLSLIWYNRKARIPAAVRKRQKSNSFAFASFTQF